HLRLLFLKHVPARIEQAKTTDRVELQLAKENLACLDLVATADRSPVEPCKPRLLHLVFSDHGNPPLAAFLSRGAIALVGIRLQLRAGESVKSKQRATARQREAEREKPSVFSGISHGAFVDDRKGVWKLLQIQQRLPSK